MFYVEVAIFRPTYVSELQHGLKPKRHYTDLL